MSTKLTKLIIILIVWLAAFGIKKAFHHRETTDTGRIVKVEKLTTKKVSSNKECTIITNGTKFNWLDSDGYPSTDVSDSYEKSLQDCKDYITWAKGREQEKSGKWVEVNDNN